MNTTAPTPSSEPYFNVMLDEMREGDWVSFDIIGGGGLHQKVVNIDGKAVRTASEFLRCADGRPGRVNIWGYDRPSKVEAS